MRHKFTLSYVLLIMSLVITTAYSQTTGTFKIFDGPTQVSTETVDLSLPTIIDPGAARDDLSNVSGAVELTLSQTVKAAWAEITGSATVGAGSAAAPSITTTGDTNTGVYFPGADSIGFSVGGAEAVRIYSGYLNVGRGNAGTYALQLGDARTENGYAFLDFVGDETYSDYGLRIIRGNTGASTTSSILHRGTGNLILRTSEAGAISFDTLGTERARITSSGNVLIGTTTNDGVNKLQVNGTIRIGTSTPASAGATGVAGTICWDADYIYVCTATNTWKRVAISTWP